MKSKEVILEHLIENMYEWLFLDQINLKLIDKKWKKMEKEFEFQSQRSKLLSAIESRMETIEIAKEMLKEI